MKCSLELTTTIKIIKMESLSFKSYESKRGLTGLDVNDLSIYVRYRNTGIKKRKSSCFKVSIPKKYVKKEHRFARFGFLDSGLMFFATNENEGLDGNLRLTNFNTPKKYLDVNCKELVFDILDKYEIQKGLDVGFKCSITFSTQLGVYIIDGINQVKYKTNKY